jgi:mannose/cellobiose epimerase-like protein (N-acyl-D-glucosamine 2-epimerase family)
MYKTANEAREAAAGIAKNYDGEKFVVTGRKLTKNARKVWYGFRTFLNEEFNGEWHQEKDRSFCRMLEIV